MTFPNITESVNTNARVAFFISRYDIGSSCSIVNSAIMLTQSGYHVDIFLYHAFNPHLVTLRDERICIHDLSDVPKASFKFSSKVRHSIKAVLRLFLPTKTYVIMRGLLKNFQKRLLLMVQ